MPDDEAEERRARWIFNLVVFFLVFAFAIDLNYMTSSILPVGIGLSLHSVACLEEHQKSPTR